MLESGGVKEEQMVTAISNLYHVFDHVPFAVAALRGPELRIDYINQYNLNVWQKKREEVIGKPLLEARPDLGETALNIHRQVYATGERFQQLAVPFNFQIGGASATTYFDVVIDPIRNPEGEMVGQLATSIEVTGQVKATEHAAAWETYFRGIADAVPTVIWMTDKTGRCTFVNKHWTQLTGQSPEELTATGWFGGIHPDDQENVRVQMLSAHQQLSPFRMLFRVRNTIGYYVWILAGGEPRYSTDGVFEGYAGTFADVDDQVNANERFELISRATQDAIWEWDLVTNKVIWNDAFYTMFSYRLEDVFLSGDWWYEQIHPLDKERVVTGIHHAIDSGKEIWADEYRFRSRDGSYKSVYDRGFIQHDPSGKPIRMVGSMQDTTERKRSEIALQELADSLELLVAERTRELVRSNEDLQQFAHVTSHDLKEPVRKILLFSDLAKSGANLSSPDRVSAYLVKIENAAKRMYDMIDGVMLYSTLQATEMDYHAVDLMEVIQQVVSDLDLLIAEKNAAVSYTALPVIHGSATLIYQLYYNLLINSLKFSREGVSPFMEISAMQASGAEIAGYQLDPNRRYVKIRFSDNGIGFRSNEAEKIFDAFLRLHSKDKYEGTGLGLSLCKKIAERHGGAIWAEGVEGMGASFYLILPVNTLVI